MGCSPWGHKESQLNNSHTHRVKIPGSGQLPSDSSESPKKPLMGVMAQGQRRVQTLTPAHILTQGPGGGSGEAQEGLCPHLPISEPSLHLSQGSHISPWNLTALENQFKTSWSGTLTDRCLFHFPWGLPASTLVFPVSMLVFPVDIHFPRAPPSKANLSQALAPRWRSGGGRLARNCFHSSSHEHLHQELFRTDAPLPF